MELAALPMANTATTFEIRCDEGDEVIGQLIKHACIDAGLVESTSAATWVLRLVSSKTDYTRACEEITELGARVICILVDSVSLPEDSRELRRRQWLDFREQLPEGLYNLLRVLRGVDYAGGGSNPVPLDTGRFRAPMEVQGFVETCRIELIMIGAFSIGLVVLHPLQHGAINLALVSLLPEIYLWRLLRSTTARLETGRNFRIRCGVFLLLVLMWTGYMGAMNLWLLVPGVTVMLSWVSGIIYPFRNLPTYWLPLWTAASKTPAVMPPLFTSHIPGLVSMSFAMGLAAAPLLFVP
jgi:hypothetical protein